MRRQGFSLVVGALALGLVAAAAAPVAQETAHLLDIDSPDPGYLHFPVRILDRSTREALTFDPAEGHPATITYSLTRDGVIRVRAVWRRDPRLVLRTLLDWTRQEFGPQSVTWDGRDASGNLVDNRGALITFEGDDPAHGEHAREDCHEPQLEIVATGVEATAELPRVAARIVRDTRFGRADGYTVRCYLDYELVDEARLDGATESFFLPCEAGRAIGGRLLIVNLEDGAGHVGVAGLRLAAAEPGATEGQRIFTERGCALCHDLETTTWREEGPGLAYLASRRPRDYVRGFIQHPRSLNRTAAMPEDPLSAEELGLLMAYLDTLERPPGETRRGRVVYRQEGCFDCHDVPGESGAMAGPHLIGIGQLRSRDYLAGVILRPGEFFPRTAMPPTLLSEVELEALIDYLRHELVLAPPESPGPG